MADNIKVCIKIRPLIKREQENNAVKHWKINNNYVINVENPSNNYLFDYAFDENTTTRELFDVVVKPIVQSSLKGFNGTIFAYGQTSSGKTHTMSGTDDEPGVIGLTVKEIFKEIESFTEREFLLRVGYIEIYNEKINDLLDKKNVDLKIHETSSGNVTVNCKEYVTNTVEQIIEYMQLGNKTKRIGETNMNDRSSRSHTIFRIIIESRECNDEDAITTSQLNLVDLAGSERADQTGANSYRLKEGAHINKSLLSLSCVIQKLSEDESMKFINYRDSKLTRILQASLGGNALTSIICTVTPASLDETMSTLNFALRAKTIKNKPTINEEVSGETMTKRLKNEIIILRNQLEVEKSKNSKILILKQISDMETQFLHSHVNKEINNRNRRRTWCPSSIPNHMSRLPVPQTTINNGNVFLKPPNPSLINEHINFRYRESMPVLSNNGDTDIDEVFVPSEEIIFDKSPKFNKVANEIKTPETFKCKIIATLTPDHISWKEKCESLEQELKELKDFTKLENNCDITHKLNENYDKINFYEIEFAKMKSNLTKKDIQIDVVQTKCADMEHKLTKVEIDLENAIKEKDIAIKEKCLAENHKISLEYEFEQFKINTKSRENELLNCLNEKRLDANIECLNNKIKDLEEKLIKTEALNFNLQSETEKINIMLLNKEEIIRELDNALRNQQSVLPEIIECEASYMRDIIINLENNIQKYEIDKNIISDNNELVDAIKFKKNMHNISELSSNDETSEFLTPLYKNEDGDFKKDKIINELDERLSSMLDTNELLKKKIIELETTILSLNTKNKKPETLDVCIETDIIIKKENMTECNLLDDIKTSSESNINYKLEYENLDKKLNDVIIKIKDENQLMQNDYDELSTELMDNIQENENLKEKLEALDLAFKMEKENYDEQLQELNLRIENLTESKENSIKLYEKVLDEKNTLDENFKQLEKDHENIVSQLSIYENELATAKKSLLEMEKEYQLTKEQNDDIEVLKNQLEETLNSKIVSLEATIEKLESNSITKAEDMEQNILQYESLVEKLAEIEEEYKLSKDQCETLKLAKNQLEETLKSEIISLDDTIKILENDKINDKELLDSLQEGIKKLNEENQIYLKKANESLLEKQQLEINNNKLKKEYEILKEKLENVDADYEKIKDQCNELMLSKNQLQLNFDLKILSLEENINKLENNSTSEKYSIKSLEDKLKMFDEKQYIFDHYDEILSEKQQLEKNFKQLNIDYEILEKKLLELETKYDQLVDQNAKVLLSKEELQENFNQKIASSEKLLKRNSTNEMEKNETLYLESYEDMENNVVKVTTPTEDLETIEDKYNHDKLMYENLVKKLEAINIEYQKTKEQLQESEEKLLVQPILNNSEIELLQEKLKKFEAKEYIFDQYSKTVKDKQLIEANYNKLKEEYDSLEKKCQDIVTKLEVLQEDQILENEETLMSNQQLENSNSNIASLQEKLRTYEEKEYIFDQYDDLLNDKKQLEINYNRIKEEYSVLEKKVIDIEGEECEKRCMLLAAVESLTDEKENLTKLMETYAQKLNQYEIDINAKNDLIEKIKEEFSIQKNENKLIENRLLNLQKITNEFEEKCCKLEESNQHLSKELNDMNDIMATNLNSYTECQGKLEHSLETLNASKEVLQMELIESKDLLQRTKDETDKTIIEFTNQLDMLRQKHDANLMVLDEMSKENTELSETVVALKSENNNFVNKIEVAESSVEKIKDTINGILYTVDKLKADLYEKKNNVKELKQKVEEFDRNATEVEAIREQLENCEKEKVSLQSQLDVYIKEKQSNDETIQILTEKLMITENQNSSYIELNQNLQKDNENIDLEIKQLNARIISITENNEVQARDALNEKNELIKQLEDFKVKNSEVELILSKELDKYQQQKQELLDLQTKNKELLNTIDEQQIKLNNLEGIIQEQNNTKSKIICELEAKLSTMLNMEEELEMTKKQINEDKLSELNLLNGLNETVKNLKNKLEDSTLIIEKQKHDLENQLKEKISSDEFLENYKSKIDSLTKQITVLELNLSESDNCIRSLNEEKLLCEIEKQQNFESLKAEINRLNINIEELNHSKEMHEAEILNLNSENILLQEKNENNEKKIEELKKLCEDYKRKISLNKDQIKKLICRIEELFQHEKELIDFKEKHEKYSETEFERLIAENCDLIKKVHQLNAEYSLLNNQYQELEDEYNSLTNNCKKQNETIASLKQFSMEKEELEKQAVQHEQTISSSNALLVKQLHEIEKMHLFKINQYEKQVNELKANELKLQEIINQHKDELRITLKKYSAIETELNMLKLKASSPTNNNKMQELQMKLKELNHETKKETLKKEKVINSLLGENTELKNKNQHLVLEIDNFRRLTKNDRKSRRQSAHDEKRQLWDNHEVETMTDPTSESCSCLDMNTKIMELKREIVIKDAHISMMQLNNKKNPFEDEIEELKNTIKQSDRIIQELRSEIGKSCSNCLKNENKLYSSKCIQNTDIKLNEVLNSRPVIDIKEYDLLNNKYSMLEKKYEQAKNICVNRKQQIIDNNLEVQTYKRLLSESEEKLNKMKSKTGDHRTMNNNNSNTLVKSNKSVQTDENFAELRDKYYLMKNIALKRKKKITILENVINGHMGEGQK